MKNSPPKVHRIRPDLEKEVDRHWLAGLPFLTHMCNSFTLLFPDAERYFIRTVRIFEGNVKSPRLKEDLKGFTGQEASHAAMHEKLWNILENQGYDTETFLTLYRKFAFDFLENSLSDKMNLSLTAGLEHFTALLAEVGLRSGYLEKSDPLMAEIFAWHAAEEIDHKSAAFDLLKETDESYILRIAGILLAAVLFTGFTSFGIVSFLSQDGLLFDERTFREISDFFFGKTEMAGNSFRIFLEYFDPSFHPSQKDIDYLAEEVFKNLNEKYPKPLSLVVN